MLKTAYPIIDCAILYAVRVNSVVYPSRFVAYCSPPLIDDNDTHDGPMSILAERLRTLSFCLHAYNRCCRHYILTGEDDDNANPLINAARSATIGTIFWSSGELSSGASLNICPRHSAVLCNKFEDCLSNPTQFYCRPLMVSIARAVLLGPISRSGNLFNNFLFFYSTSHTIFVWQMLPL